MLDEINIKFPNFFSCDEFCSPSGALICAQLKPRICYRGIFSIAGGIFPIRSLKSFQARITLRKVGVEKSGEKADNVECELETFGFYFWTLLILSATWEELKFHEVGFVPVMRKPMVVGLMSTSGGLFSTHIDECDVTC